MSLLNCARAANENKTSKKKPESKPLDAQNDKSLKQKNSKSDQKVSNEMSNQVGIQYLPICHHYELSVVIGKGHSGSSSIFLAKHLPTASLIAIKKINVEVWDRELSYIQNEIILTQQLSHPNILQLHCSFVKGHELWIVMPLMAFGSCRDLIHAYFNSGLPEQAILFILRDVLLAVEYIHQRGIIHRGIKASHVLISKNGQVCLTGLHNSYNTIQNGKKLRKVHDFPIHSVDCLQSFSPELLHQNLAGYNFKSDIYSIGILICELANGQSPFSDMPATQMLLEKLNGTKPKLADSTTVGDFIIDDDGNDDQPGTTQERADVIFFKRTFSQNLHEFTSECLELDVVKRPSATQLLNHSVFKSIKNRPSSSLPSLLQPVTPLTDLAKVPRDLSAEEEDFTRKMSEVSMQEDWTF
ncbi:STE20-related kinase adapter protein alpha-like isoform X1 [Biomphalaria glabrata]|uniref:Protein kinase domain-containing protein n=2 Tax=Biomphalaria glabrata TaxID=6526 RepID=A0A2C9LZS6_BIOGL|nr:STE20-related kinase adapter protein alpha-like isoform X1 [Biomphalaria glabrata]KAI8778188.1 STE20-related kinase adapter protein alpha isoform X1 [Biomphalaria glabrata]